MNIWQLKDKLRLYKQARQYNERFLTYAQKHCLPTEKIRSDRAKIETEIVTLKKKIRELEKSN